MRRKCRIWWPKQLSSYDHSSSIFLFGWFLSCSSSSLDIVVAFAFDELSLSHSQSGIQGILHNIDGKMPVNLQDKSMFSMLGHCASDGNSNGQLPGLGMEENDHIKSFSHGNLCSQNSQDVFGENNGRWKCGCHKADGLLEHCRQASIGSGNWVQLLYDSHKYILRDVRWIPKLHHIHWNGQIMCHCDFHVIVYETPRFGTHHLSLNFWNSSEEVKDPMKKPNWITELYQKQPLLDMDTVILAINCSAAANMLFERFAGLNKSTIRFPIVYMFVAFTWQLLAVSFASFSTIFYVILQLLHCLLRHGSQSWIYITLAKAFSNTWKNIHIRSCQVLYWPIFLQNSGPRAGSCVEYAEKAALHRHSMWTSVAVDVILGNLVGLALLFHSESICLWVLNFVNNITNNLLRSGCVWLMGVPAGFKLNTELARVLGMISLNAIQIWSTLWFFAGFLFVYFIKGLAISGIFFGVTVPASLIIDMIVLATLHVSALHWLVSFLYSQQIQAIAALWRLFRGRKWNPLRQRLDSYDYTVEQHIVGSLLFTLILLLLPTTTVFYIFFSLVNTTISVICILIEITISIVHATPYMEAFLWLVRPRRFPSGMWLEVISCHGNAINSPVIECINEIGSPFENLQQRRDIADIRSSVLVSFLHSNLLNIGQIVLPHYRYIFSGASRPFVASSAYGILTGRSFPSTLGTILPSTMPWIFIPWKDYWHLCHGSVLACMADCDHN